jgi:type 1 glutamine amidotransferase
MKKKLTIILLTIILLLCAACSDVAKYSAESERIVKVAVVTGGHDFDEKAFFSMFDSFDGIEYTHLSQKDHSEIFENIDDFSYDVIVLYNMTQKISPKRQANFIRLLNKNTGLVALHHSIAAFDDWREYEKIIGARYFHKEAFRNGEAYKKSSYKHDVDIPVNIENKSHPITRGLKDFMIHDETYKDCFFQKDNNILLTTNEPTNDKSICWTRQYGRSRVCYIQLGHGSEAYNNENYRALVANAVKWSAGKLN